MRYYIIHHSEGIGICKGNNKSDVEKRIEDFSWNVTDIHEVSKLQMKCWCVCMGFKELK